MGLFAKEQFQTITQSSSNPDADTVQFRGANCWPSGEEGPAEIHQAVNVRVAPNPFEDQTYVMIKGGESLSNPYLRITDFSGRVVESRRFEASERVLSFLIDGTAWPAGIYMLVLYDGETLLASHKLTRITR
jgi:hypothetical protein